MLCVVLCCGAWERVIIGCCVLCCCVYVVCVYVVCVYVVCCVVECCVVVEPGSGLLFRH